ncbi:MAG: DUF3459 domain-containing protein [Chloroflexi bacterium]|nr:DUF3459 domain-containing protein [Chloroflexota bacterium]
MGDNLNLPDRDGVRTPMQWNDSPYAGFSDSKPFTEVLTGEYGSRKVNVAAQLVDKDSLFHTIRRMISIRREHPAFGNGATTWIDAGNPSTAVYLRRHLEDEVLVLNNLSSTSQTIRLPVEHQVPHFDLFSGREIDPAGLTTLPPHDYRWLSPRKSGKT